MILECILVRDDDPEEWTSDTMEFRFKNTDKDEKEIEIFAGTGFNRNLFLFTFSNFFLIEIL